MSFQATGGFKTELLFEICQLLEISVDRSLGIYTTILWLIIFSISVLKSCCDKLERVGYRFESLHIGFFNSLILFSASQQTLNTKMF